MSDETKVYISVEGRSGQLVIDGPIKLFDELLDAFGRRPDERTAVRAAAEEPAEEPAR